VGVWVAHDVLVYDHKVKCFQMRWTNGGMSIVAKNVYDSCRPIPITLDIVLRRRNNNQRIVKYDYVRKLYSMLVVY
jgi:hypothetical protein